MCIPAENAPVLNNTNRCQPLIELKNPFCEYYGIKLDKYVNVPARRQEKYNRILWSYEEIYEWHNISASTDCLHEARFLACHNLFPGCDLSTSVFMPKTFCQESCLSFIGKCSRLAGAWKDVNGLKILPNCSDKPLRSAGNSPECAFYARKLESVKNEGILVGKLIANV